MNLGIDDDELASCVSCGMCLPHCPTYRVTGKEAYSPRGRIDAMRAVQLRDAAVDTRFVEFMESCVQCRGCEPACPSGVPFGHLMEATRSSLAAQRRTVPWWQRLGYRVLAHHRLLILGSRLAALAQRARLLPRRLGLGPIPLRQGPALTSTGTDVWLYTGCVMDAWQRRTHRASAQVLSRLGRSYQVPRESGCCGALHTHAGLSEEARRLMEATMAQFPGEAPILVNSAGCGAALSEYGHHLGTEEARRFSARVSDIHAYCARILRERPDALGAVARNLGPVIVQDPCHLRHVQRAHLGVREVLRQVAVPVELGDEGLCCGAGGAYSALQPELAGQIRERKLAAILDAARSSGSTCVVSANPGCSQHLSTELAAHGIRVVHPMDLVAEAL